jgi:plasmid stabilization system protein ParE
MGRSEEDIKKAYALRITENAFQNINEITGYIAFVNHEPLNAIRVGDELFKTIDKIHINPTIFPECQEIPTINKIYRKAICIAWLIIFKIRPFEIVILGIIHQHRRPSSIKGIRKVQ